MSCDPVTIYGEASTRVSAYRKFLEERCGEVPRVETLDDFRRLPMMKKADYAAYYPLQELLLDGTILGKHSLVKSSGTTGKGFFWPITQEEHLGVVPGMKAAFSRILAEDRLPTLAAIAFPLGSWSTGVTSCVSFTNLAAAHRGLTVVTPGCDTEEILLVLDQLSPMFRQTLLFTFPPHAKAVLEEARRRGMPLESYNLMLVVGGEGISESFREHLIRYIRPNLDDLTAVWSVYGSADFGDVGYESHACIALRRILHENGLARQILGTDEIPMIFQSPQGGAYFEIVDEEMVVSRLQGAPIVRYRTGDRVAFVPYLEMAQRVRDAGYDLRGYLKTPSLHPEHEAPFLLLYGRVDGAVFFYGAYITVDQVRCALESPALEGLYTGRFLMRTVARPDGDATLEITLEDTPAVREADPAELSRRIADAMSRTQEQYREFCLTLGENALPRIVLAPAEVFKAGWKSRHKAVV